MPYINSSKRDVINPTLEPVLNVLRELECDDERNNTEGNINYIFTRILQHCYPGRSYREVNDCMGILESCKQEYYRRIAAPLENQKAWENGDVLPEFVSAKEFVETKVSP